MARFDANRGAWALRAVQAADPPSRAVLEQDWRGLVRVARRAEREPREQSAAADRRRFPNAGRSRVHGKRHWHHRDGNSLEWRAAHRRERFRSALRENGKGAANRAARKEHW